MTKWKKKKIWSLLGLKITQPQMKTNRWWITPIALLYSITCRTTFGGNNLNQYLFAWRYQSCVPCGGILFHSFLLFQFILICGHLFMYSSLKVLSQPTRFQPSFSCQEYGLKFDSGILWYTEKLMVDSMTHCAVQWPNITFVTSWHYCRIFFAQMQLWKPKMCCHVQFREKIIFSADKLVQSVSDSDCSVTNLNI